MLYTGLPDFITVQYVFEIESFIEHGALKLCTQSVGEMNMYNLKQKFKLQRVNEFVIGLMRLILMEKSCEFQCFENFSDTKIVLECTKNLFKVHHHWRTNILSIQAWCHASSCQ